jgi:hypothetical protein
LIVAQLAQYNDIALDGSSQDVIDRISESISKDDTLALPGGIRVIDEGQREISPGCCCGLEEWHEWIDFLESGKSPWCGHDPGPCVDSDSGVIRIWSDNEENATRFCIETRRFEFAQALACVEHDLESFLFCIEKWAHRIGVRDSSPLIRTFDQCFHITK